MKKLMYIFFIFLLLCMSPLGVNNALADFNIPDSITSTLTPISTANLNFKFKLVASDDLTKGKVTSDTRTIDFSLILENDSRYTLPYIKINFSNVTILNSLGDIMITQNPASETAQLFNVMPYSSNYVLFTPPNTGIGVIYPNGPLQIKLPVSLSGNGQTLLSMQSTITIYDSTAEANSASFSQNTTDVIYTPSNDDLIPTLVTTTNHISQLVTDLWARLVASVST